MRLVVLAALGGMVIGSVAFYGSAQAQSGEQKRRGCTSVGPEQCLYLGSGKRRVQLVPQAGVATPPDRTYIIATGKLRPVEVGFCGVKQAFDATAITVTKRYCAPAKSRKKQ